MPAKRPIERSQIVWSVLVSLVLAGVVYVYTRPASHEASGDLNRDVQLYLGFLILFLLSCVIAFTARKWGLFLLYAWVLKPRPGMDEYLDQARWALKDLQRKIDKGIVSNIRDVRERARKILQETHVEASMQLSFGTKMVGDRKVIEVDMFRKEPFGRLFRWLEVHIFFGLLGFCVALIHADFSLGGPIAAATLIFFFLTTLSGLVGLYYYFVIPSRLASHETEITYGETRKQLEKIEDEIENLISGTSEGLQKAFKPYIGSLVAGAEVKLGELKGLGAKVDEKERSTFERGLVMLGQAERLESYYRPQHVERRHLESWLWLHIPFSVATLILMVIHMFSVWYY